MLNAGGTDANSVKTLASLRDHENFGCEFSSRRIMPDRVTVQQRGSNTSRNGFTRFAAERVLLIVSNTDGALESSARKLTWVLI